MSKDTDSIVLERLLRYLSALYADIEKLAKDTRSLQDRARDLELVITDRSVRGTSDADLYSGIAERGKLDLVGKLPMTLVSKRHFPTTDSLKAFAGTLGLTIPLRPSGRMSRNELVGAIVVWIAGLPDSRMPELREALDKVFRKTRETPTSNFVSEWENVIRQFPTKR